MDERPHFRDGRINSGDFATSIAAVSVVSGMVMAWKEWLAFLPKAHRVLQSAFHAAGLRIQKKAFKKMHTETEFMMPAVDARYLGVGTDPVPNDPPTTPPAHSATYEKAEFTDFSASHRSRASLSWDQMKRAERLGLSIPRDASSEELSDLISLSSWRDNPAPAPVMELAKRYGVPHTRFSGTKLLYERIFQHLKGCGDTEALAAFFAWRVFRATNPKASDSVTMDSPLICAVASRLAKNSIAMQSVARYRGENLVHFGQWRLPNGSVREGGSQRSEAYKETVKILRIVSKDPLFRKRSYDPRHLSTFIKEATSRVHDFRTRHPAYVTRLSLAVFASCLAIIGTVFALV